MAKRYSKRECTNCEKRFAVGEHVVIIDKGDELRCDDCQEAITSSPYNLSWEPWRTRYGHIDEDGDLERNDY